jgi:hypothetical protein
MVFIMVYSLYHPFMVILGMIYYCFTHDPLRAGVRVSRSSMVAPVAAGSTRGDLVAKGWWQWSEQDLAPHISLSTKNTSKGNTARKPQFLKGTFRLVIYIYTFKPNYNYITRPLNDLTYKCIQMCFLSHPSPRMFRWLYILLQPWEGWFLLLHQSTLNLGWSWPGVARFKVNQHSYASLLERIFSSLNKGWTKITLQ